eukprot:SAG11_NODE_1348_length_5137_cov_3.785232_6_plen_77_part_00
MITDLLINLAEQKPELEVAVVVVFIASEESTAIQSVGVDMLVDEGKLGELAIGLCIRAQPHSSVALAPRVADWSHW